MEQVADTVDVDACRVSYYTNLFPLNPGGIIPSGPTQEDLGLLQSTGRGSQALEEMFYLKEAHQGLVQQQQQQQGQQGKGQRAAGLGSQQAAR